MRRVGPSIRWGSGTSVRRRALTAIVKPLEVYNHRPDVPALPVSIEPAVVDAFAEQTSAGRVSRPQAGLPKRIGYLEFCGFLAASV